MITEEFIKSKLDGWFFALGVTRGTEAAACVIPTRVPLDFMPDHGSKQDETDAAQEAIKQRKVKVREWTASEDSMLLNLRHDGARWDFVAWELKRNVKAVCARYAFLAAKHGIKPIRLKPGALKALSKEQKEQIVHLRDKEGLSFDEITERMGLKKFVARDYYHRRLRHLREQLREAA